MMAVIDYLGYRVIAVARIRMSQRTLVYARSNGKTVIAADKVCIRASYSLVDC